MIKLNEKNEQKLKQAHEEIRQMKQAKVRLIRQMKEDADKVRTWKIQKEKEVNQLKQTERKQQVKLAKMENVYNKQLNVAKRKLEEANARTQRLKDVMDKQKANKKSAGMFICIFSQFFTSFHDFPLFSPYRWKTRSGWCCRTYEKPRVPRTGRRGLRERSQAKS